jgi:hypothetical protein
MYKGLFKVSIYFLGILMKWFYMGVHIIATRTFSANTILVQLRMSIRRKKDR